MIYALGDRRPEFEGDGHFVADNATIIGSVRLSDHASVWFNCVLRGDNDWLIVGARSNIQDGSVLHTDDDIQPERLGRHRCRRRFRCHGDA